FTVKNSATGASALHLVNDTLIDSNFANIPHATTDGTFYVDLPPIASFSVYSQGTEKQLLQSRELVFNASSSRDPDSTYDPNDAVPLSCTWTFGDGSPASTGCSSSHSYSTA